MATPNPETNFENEAIFFFEGQINNSEFAEIKDYSRENIADYVRSNFCYEMVTNLKVTKEEWLEMVQGYERQLKTDLFPFRRCFAVAKFNTILQNDYGSDIKGCEDFFVYFFFWAKNRQTEEVNYIISGVRVKHSHLKETKGWFFDGKKINHKITKFFIHLIAKESINRLKGGK